MELQGILVPTDFSANADRALQYAVDVAKRSGATVHLVYVPAIPTYPLMDAALAVTPDGIRQIFAEAQESLDALATKHCGDEVRWECAVCEPPVHHAINEYASQNAIDLIVMGTHGRAGISKVVFGSVTARALRTARTPMIVVPPQGGAPPTSIVVAYDFSEPARQAADVARKLQDLFHARVCMVHAYLDVWAEHADRGGVVGEPAERRRKALRQGLMEMLEAAAAELLSGETGQTETMLLTGDPTEVVLRVAEEVDAQLICAGTTGKAGVDRVLLGSVARKLIQGSKVPLLVAHAGGPTLQE